MTFSLKRRNFHRVRVTRASVPSVELGICKQSSMPSQFSPEFGFLHSMCHINYQARLICTFQIWQIFCEKLINILWKCFLQTLIHSLKWGFPERIQIERHCNPVSASRNQNPSFIEVFLEFQQKYYLKFASKGNTYYEIPNWVQLSALRNQKGNMKLSIEHNYLKYMSGRKAKVPNFTSYSYWGRSIKLPTFKIYDTPAQDVLQISSDLSV